MKQRHQFLDRETGRLVDEKLYADGVIRFLYSTLRERAPIIFRAATGEKISGLLGFINYDLYLGGKITGHRHFLKYCGIELGECLENPEELDTIKKIFQRKNQILGVPADAGQVGGCRLSCGCEDAGRFALSDIASFHQGQVFRV